MVGTALATEEIFEAEVRGCIGDAVADERQTNSLVISQAIPTLTSQASEERGCVGRRLIARAMVNDVKTLSIVIRESIVVATDPVGEEAQPGGQADISQTVGDRLVAQERVGRELVPENTRETGERGR